MKHTLLVTLAALAFTTAVPVPATPDYPTNPNLGDTIPTNPGIPIDVAPVNPGTPDVAPVNPGIPFRNIPEVPAPEAPVRPFRRVITSIGHDAKDAAAAAAAAQAKDAAENASGTNAGIKDESGNNLGIKNPSTPGLKNPSAGRDVIADLGVREASLNEFINAIFEMKAKEAAAKTEAAKVKAQEADKGGSNGLAQADGAAKDRFGKRGINAAQAPRVRVRDAPLTATVNGDNRERADGHADNPPNVDARAPEVETKGEVNV